MIIVSINNNNTVIINNYRRLQDLIIVSQISIGMRKNFFENSRQGRSIKNVPQPSS